MHWRYYIPHEWETGRAVWEDVYLFPDHKNWTDGALHLTVDALGAADNPLHGSDRMEFKKYLLAELSGRKYCISRRDAGDLIINTEDFSRDELLGWIKIWLEDQGFLVDGFRVAHCDEIKESINGEKFLELVAALY